MTDIFEHWKTQRFVVSNVSTDDLDSHMVVLTDIQYWVNNYDDLVDWCCIYGGEVKGITVDLPNKATMTLFCLKWA